MSRPILIVTALTVFIVMVVTSYSLWTSPFLREQGDLAANALQAARAGEGRELLGPYSQHGFHHPGPALFYYQSLTEPLLFMFPSFMARYLAAQLLLNLALFAAAMWLLHRAGLPAAGAVCGLFLVAAPLLFLGGGNMFQLASFWGPLVVVGPMILFVAAMARLAEGDLVAAPFAAASGTMAWHTNVLTIPPLILIGLLAFAWQLRTRPRYVPGVRSRRGVMLCVAAIVTLTAGLVPVAMEQATGKPGNLTLMWRFLRGYETRIHAWSEIIRQLGQAFTDPLVVLFPSTARLFGGLAGTLAVVVTMIGISVVQFGRSSPAWRLVLVFTWTTIAAAVALARHVAGELHVYLFYYVYGMVGLLYVSVVQAILTRRPQTPTGIGRRAELSAALAGIALLIPWLMAHPVAPPASTDEVTTVISSLTLTEAAAIHLSLGPGEQDQDLWHLVPTFALRLRRAGVRVTVDERFVIVCGEERRERTDGARPQSLLFTRVQPAPEQRDYVQIADWGVFLVPATVDPARVKVPALPAAHAGNADKRDIGR